MASGRHGTLVGGDIMQTHAMYKHWFSRGPITLLLILIGIPLVLTGFLPLQIVGGAMLLLALFTPSLGKSLPTGSEQNRGVEQLPGEVDLSRLEPRERGRASSSQQGQERDHQWRAH